MSGELILENGKWKARLPAAVLAAAAAAGCTWWLMGLLMERGVEGIALEAAAAVIVLVLIWALYPLFARLLPGGSRRVVPWKLTADTLILGEERIPRERIVQVYCWGGTRSWTGAVPGWVVNIETRGKHYLLRSLTGGRDMDRSVRQLRALVTALGYGSQWRPGS